MTALAAIGGIYWGPVVVQAQAGRIQSEIMADFNSGQVHLEKGQAKLTAANTNRDLAALSEARLEFRAARRDFQRARGTVNESGIGLLAYLPSRGTSDVGVKARTAVGLTDMATSLVDAALAAVDADSVFLQPPAGTDSGSRLLAILREENYRLGPLRNYLESARSAAARVDLNAIPNAQRLVLAKAVSSIEKGITSIDRLVTLIPALIEILGGNGPRTYLIEQVNPAELRGGGGFIGTYSLLTADHGKLDLSKSGSIDDVDYPRPNAGQAGYITPPGPLQEFVGEKSWVLGDSNFYPDFRLNAKAAESFAKKELKVAPAGVLSIDPYAIVEMLTVIGPVAVPDFNVTVQAKGFVTDLFERETAANRRADRKQFLSSLARELFARISAMPVDRWPALLSALNKSATARHLQVYFNSDKAEAEMNTYGWSGAMNPTRAGDFLMELESNFGGTKANFFVDRSYDVSFTRDGDTLRTRVTVNLKDSTPYGYSGREYRCYVRLYVPTGAKSPRVANLFRDKIPTDETEPGMQLMDGWLQINVDAHRGYGTWQMTFEYEQPWAPTSSGEHQVYWQKQAGTLADEVRITWVVGERRFTTNGDLGQDRVVTLKPGGVSLSAGQAIGFSLPSISL